jgi:hypothetical protein
MHIMLSLSKHYVKDIYRIGYTYLGACNSYAIDIHTHNGI